MSSSDSPRPGRAASNAQVATSDAPDRATLRLSRLPHTWLVDLDGTVLRHNGHLNGGDELLPGVAQFWASIPAGDLIVLLSARPQEYREPTLQLLSQFGLLFDAAVFGLPAGERILVNDVKPAGLATAHAVNLPRDAGPSNIEIEIDEHL